MRDPARLDKFYDRLKELHKKEVPDWRVGQLFINLYRWIVYEENIDMFFLEEDRLIELIEKFLT